MLKNRVMKKINCAIIIVVFALFAHVGLVNADDENVVNVCEYTKEIKIEQPHDITIPTNITITFDEAGTPTINTTNLDNVMSRILTEINPYYNAELGLSSNNKIDSQLKELYGLCPSELFVCDYVEYSVQFGKTDIGLIIKNIKSFFDSDSDFEQLSKPGNMVMTRYIDYSQTHMYEEHKELANIPNRHLSLSFSGADDFKDGYTTCSNIISRAALGASELINAVCGVVWNISAPYISRIPRGDSIESIAITYKDCSSAQYTGTKETYNLACPYIMSHIVGFNKAIDNYQNECNNPNSSPSCKLDALNDVNKQEANIKRYCKEIFSHHNFDGLLEQDCLESCLQVADQIREAKKEAGLINTDGGDCGFSGRLLAWINNIMKWIKYILPAFVIIFSIIDFIKAITSDKDDEMKKSQKKFIIRLIAAALTFLVPLIITFILEKMGFDANSCSLW